MTMGKRYVSSGAISAGTVYSQAISADYSKHIIEIYFYSDSGLTTLVDKSVMTGTVTFTATNSDSTNAGVDQEYGSVEDGEIALGTSTYVRPVISSQVSMFRCVFGSVTGATHYKLIVGSNAG